MFRIYLQSYLKWLYLQNPNITNFTTTELVNYLLTHFEHPEWIKNKLKNNGFIVIKQIDEYISKYKLDSEHYEINSNLIPIDKIEFDSVPIPKKPTAQQLLQAQILAKKANYRISNKALQTASEEEIIFIINACKEKLKN